jgi:16S rRNA (guanine527-N7)-methyltransferase
MDNTKFAEYLISGAAELGVVLDNEQAGAFIAFKEFLLEWNEKINLTAITDDEGFLVKHFLDSLSVARFIKSGASVLDVGTGAGFPGVPLRLARTDIEVTLLDSTNKRLKFIEKAAEMLGISVKTVHARAEDAGRDALHREMYDVVVSRAVADMPLLTEICMPLVAVGGVFIAMKGPNLEGGLGAGTAVHSLDLPYSDLLGENVLRNILITKKIRKTSAKYPRNSAELARIYRKNV